MRSLGIKFVRVAEFAWSRFEPEPETFNFNWLGRFLELVKNEGLAAVVGTPTASPPKWLVDSMPDMIALDKNGLPRAFGSRRHYCFSHEGYRVKCRQMVTRLAEATVTDRTTLTRNLGLLEHQGLIRVDMGKDRREREVRLTDRGREVLAHEYPIWKEVQVEVAKRYGSARLARLLSELSALVKVAKPS